MTEEEKKVFIKIKDRLEYFTRDDRFEERNLFEKECLFEIRYLTEIIEKLQKENEELKRNSISKKRIEKFLEVIKPQAMLKDIFDDLEIDEEGLLSKMYNSGAVGALETILDRNDAYKKGKQNGKEF